MIHPLNDVVKPKSSFIPSRWEAKQVSRLVHAIKMGWLKPRKKPERPKFYMLWGDGDKVRIKLWYLVLHSLLHAQAESTVRHHMHIPAPKQPLPGHEESYNPPLEYLPTPSEVGTVSVWHIYYIKEGRQGLRCTGQLC